jgi:NifU-like protein involved in Fe-S cluster formation
MFSQTALDHISSPRNAGRLQSFTHYGCGGVPGDGPYVELWFQVEGSKVIRAGQESNGCPSTMACASYISTISVGREVEAIQKLSSTVLILLIGGLPPGKERSAELAVEALQDALGSALGAVTR